MNKLLIPIFFVVVFVAQWFVPAQLIYQQENVLTQGSPYKFKTIPIDPSDPLRGTYIRLQYELNAVKVTDSTISDGAEFYLYLSKDAHGFAKATAASADKIENGQDYIKLVSTSTYEGEVYFQLPFTSFYMEESKAYEAEASVRKASRDTIPLNCYGLVYIKDGRAVLKDVMVNDMSIKDYVIQQGSE